MNLRLLLLFFSTIILGSVYGCSCPNYGAQTSACDSHFVVRVKTNTGIVQDGNGAVIPEEQQFMEVDRIKHTLTIQEILHTSEPGLRGVEVGSTFIHFRRVRLSCGAKLQDNTEYLVAGDVIRGQIRIYSCSFVRKWSELTEAELRGFRGEFYPNCPQ
ncbi:hypothetical protein B566_EDAN014947 [Ephemera danica]|nr:hypothetical protein B566_EDAN014947 [Ephemera danica]